MCRAEVLIFTTKSLLEYNSTPLIIVNPLEKINVCGTCVQGMAQTASPV